VLDGSRESLGHLTVTGDLQFGLADAKPTVREVSADQHCETANSLEHHLPGLSGRFDTMDGIERAACGIEVYQEGWDPSDRCKQSGGNAREQDLSRRRVTGSADLGALGHASIEAAWCNWAKRTTSAAKFPDRIDLLPSECAAFDGGRAA
jgi:hypothetical protein